MPVPLSADANVLGRLAVRTAPRLATMLMASHHSGMQLVATPHRAGATPAASIILSPSNPLARWGEHAVAAVSTARSLRVAARASVAEAATVAPPVRTPVSVVSALYKRLLGEGTTVSRPRLLDEQVEAAQPAGPGQSAPVLSEAEHVATDRTSELVALTALVVGVGYGDQAYRTGGGAGFDVTVFRNLASAADAIAPGLSLTSLDPVRMRAILTAGLQSSNGAFLAQMKETGRVPECLASASRLVPDGGKVAAEFTERGLFDEAAFLKKTTGSLSAVTQLAGATPVGAKAMLLIAAAQKAEELLPQLKRENGTRVALRSRIQRSISDRLSEMDTPQPPTDGPTAPGVR